MTIGYTDLFDTEDYWLHMTIGYKVLQVHGTTMDTEDYWLHRTIGYTEILITHDYWLHSSIGPLITQDYWLHMTIGYKVLQVHGTTMDTHDWIKGLQCVKTIKPL